VRVHQRRERPKTKEGEIGVATMPPLKPGAMVRLSG